MPDLLRRRRGSSDLGEIRPPFSGLGQKRRSALEAIAKPDFTVILNGVKDLKSLKIEILRFAQNDIFGQTGVLQ
jgi:hypothetical protein